MVQSSDCLSILLKIFFLAWNSMLLGLLKLTGHPKNMVLLNGLSSWSIFSLTKFWRLETNRTTIGLLSQFVTVISLALSQPLLFSSFLTIKDHTFLELLCRLFDNYLIFSILGLLSRHGRLSMWLIVKFLLGLQRCVRRQVATPVIENEIGSGFT